MGQFEQFRDLLVKNYQDKVADKKLYTVEADSDTLWSLYLDSFPAGTNEVYRTRREYDCSCCRHFIREAAKLVWIDDDFHRHSLFEFDAHSNTYQPVVDAIARYVQDKPIIGLYLRSYSRGHVIGTVSSIEHTETGGLNRWKHFYLPLSERSVWVPLSFRSETVGEAMSKYRSSHDVFKRSLEEISKDAVDTLLELIASNNLYRGSEWKHALEQFKLNQIAIDTLDDAQKENYYWEMCDRVGIEVSSIRNHSIGVLLQDLSAGVDIEAAVRKYENIVAPSNYMRPKAIFTQKMLDNAQKTVEEMGYMESLPRRFAVLDDIPVKHMLFSNKDVDKPTESGNVFAQMSADTKSKRQDFSNANAIPLQKFVDDVLPMARSVEVYFENRHEKNLVSLIAPKNPDAKSMLKWSNGFSWAYNGNLASSDTRANVQDAGGNVNGVLRFSIQWNEDNNNEDDLDAHCILPNSSEHIYYGHKRDWLTGGTLDVDIIEPRVQRPGKAAVENIVFPSLDKLTPGIYKFFVHCYTHRQGTGGFRAEIEYDGVVHHYEYTGEIQYNGIYNVADVIVDTSKNIGIARHHLTPGTGSKKIWGVPTNHFVPVSVICESPNYWGENAVGSRHVMFMLKDCKNPDTPNGFFNEYLKNDLMKHRRVFEALGSRMKVEPTENQLSGLGFNTTQRGDLIVRVKGAATQVLRVMF